MPSPATIYGNVIRSSTDWTNTSDALGAPNGVSALGSTPGNAIVIDLSDLNDLASVISVEFGLTWTATTTGSRTQNLSVRLEGYGGVNTVTTANRNSATLITNTFTTPISSGTQTNVNNMYMTITPQEGGGGMPGTTVYYVDSVFATIVYNESGPPPPAPDQLSRVMFIGL